MKKKKEERNFIKNPVYKGGKEALLKFIQLNLKYPTKALEAAIEGTVYIKYSIDYQGNVIDTKVLKDLGYGCDEEAIRVVKLLKFKTFKTRKIKIRYHKEIKIHFKLPHHNKEETRVDFTYNYTTSSNNKSHTYTINIK